MYPSPTQKYVRRQHFISSALCYCTKQLLSSRGGPSSLLVVRPSVKPFSRKPASELKPSCEEWYLSTISPDNFKKKYLYIFLYYYIITIITIFVSFSLTWDDMGGTVSNDISPDRAQHIHSPKFMYTTKDGLNQRF